MSNTQARHCCCTFRLVKAVSQMSFCARCYSHGDIGTKLANKKSWTKLQFVTPQLCHWTAHRQWHPVVEAHPLTRLTFQAAITAQGPPIQTKTPTHGDNGITVHTQGQPSLLCLPFPSAPGPILLLILTHSLEESSIIACFHINVKAITTSPGSVFAVRLNSN